MATIIEHEAEQVRRANATERQPVVGGWRTVADTALAFVRRFV